MFPLLSLPCRFRSNVVSKLPPQPQGVWPRRKAYTTTIEAGIKVDPINAQLDYRTFLDILRQDNDLLEINKEADPHLEIGAIIRRVSEVNDKAPLFNNVKGCRDGLWRIAGNAASLRGGKQDRYGRIARSLGLPPTASWKEICQKWQSAKKSEVLKPNIISTGPCKENKLIGDEIDLTKLPVPFLHQADGGKYLQTYGVNVLQTPDKLWTNWSIFRGMVSDRNHLVCLVGSGQHNSVISDKWLAEGKVEVPWALAFGVGPAISLTAAMPVPENVSEAEFVGALVGRPLDLVKCELSDLLVPANSEIVLEGSMSLTEKANEGPFEDYMGLIFDGEQRMQPLFTVNAITYRNNAILPVSVPGRITDESHTTSALASAEILELLQVHGLPILDAHSPLQTHATWCALKVDNKKLADMKTNSPEFCKRVGNLVFRNKSTMLVNRVLLFGDDVDIYDFDSVIWAMVTRCRPGDAEHFFEDVPSLPITPYNSFGASNPTRGGKVISDCLFPMEYQGKKTFREVSFESSYPDEIKARVRSNWKQMGFQTS